MCNNPIIIKNNKKGVISPYRDKRYMTVSCGHCPQCLESKKQGYVTRAVLEYDMCLKRKGFGYFITLTYDNRLLPLSAQLQKDKIKGSKTYGKNIVNDVPVFNKKDVEDYLKNVRIKLQRTFGWQSPLSFLAVSEYGGSTKRPHMHILLFHPYKLSSLKQQNLYEDIVLNTWNYGFCDPSLKNRGYLESTKAIFYLLKYVGKDMSFQQQYKQLKRSSTLFHEEDLKDVLKRNVGFVKCSKSLGLGYIDSITADEWLNGKINYNADVKLFIPPYYYRHKFYKKEDVILPSGVSRVRFVPNKEGIAFQLKRYQYKQNKSRKDYLNILNGLVKGFDPELTDKLLRLNQLQQYRVFHTQFDVYDFFVKEFPNAEYFFRYTNILRGCYSAHVADFTESVRDIPVFDLYAFTFCFDYNEDTKDFVLGDYTFSEYAQYINNYLSVHEYGHELALLIVKLLKLNAYELKQKEFLKESKELDESLSKYWKKQRVKHKF